MKSVRVWNCVSRFYYDRVAFFRSVTLNRDLNGPFCYGKLDEMALCSFNRAFDHSSIVNFLLFFFSTEFPCRGLKASPAASKMVNNVILLNNSTTIVRLNMLEPRVEPLFAPFLTIFSCNCLKDPRIISLTTWLLIAFDLLLLKLLIELNIPNFG